MSGNQYSGGGAASSAGYLSHPTCTTAQPYVSYRIDTTGSLDPLVIFNS